jgi:hypothetical protein
MEKIEFKVAERGKVLGSWLIPAYWTLNFGREDLERMFQESDFIVEPGMFDQIHKIRQGKFNKIDEEHFIIRRKEAGQYTIEDRNKPPITYVNEQLIKESPIRLNSGDIIAVPLVRGGILQSCLIQVSFFQDTSPSPPIKQLGQCARKGEKYLIYWVEDSESRNHFAEKTEKVPANTVIPKTQESKNLRPVSQVPCPYCGSMYSGYDPICKIYICHDGESEKWTCIKCKHTFRLSEMRGSNIDIKTV